MRLLDINKPTDRECYGNLSIVSPPQIQNLEPSPSIETPFIYLINLHGGGGNVFFLICRLRKFVLFFVFTYYSNIKKMTKTIETMQYRFLGNSGLKVSAISLGGWYVTISYIVKEKNSHSSSLFYQLYRMTLGSTVDENQAYAIMSRAFELGINFFDNAEVYASKWGKPC
jgi:hypothetical protein